MLLRKIFVILTTVILCAIVGLLYFSDYTDDQYLSYLGKAYPVNSGYILASQFSGKLRDLGKLQKSLNNLLALQCWAFSLPVSVRVVEPDLLYESYFGVELESGRKSKRRNKIGNGVALFDLFNARLWKKYTLKKRLSGLVSRNYFLKYAPKKIILVDKVCSRDSISCMKCNNNGTNEPSEFVRSSYSFAKRHNFTIVRKTCYDDNHKYSTREFQRLIYGKLEPDETVVVFNHFEGFQLKSNKKKITISWKQCMKFDNVLIPTSSKISRLSTKYVKRFLLNGNKKKGYISIMLNVESFVRRRPFKGKSKIWQMAIMRKCVDKIVKKVESLKKLTKVSSIFLMTDMERQVSYNLSKEGLHEGVLQMGQNELHKRLFDEQLNLTSRIKLVATLRIPYYLKLLETTIASNGTCLVLAGGGTYQKMATAMYKAAHKNKNNIPKCKVETITEC